MFFFFFTLSSVSGCHMRSTSMCFLNRWSVHVVLCTVSVHKYVQLNGKPETNMKSFTDVFYLLSFSTVMKCVCGQASQRQSETCIEDKGNKMFCRILTKCVSGAAIRQREEERKARFQQKYLFAVHVFNIGLVRPQCIYSK